MAEQEWPETFELLIGVTKHHDKLLLDWPAFFSDAGWCDNGVHADDAGIQIIPTEPGVYRCTISWGQSHEDDDPDFLVERAERVVEVQHG